MSTNTCQVSRLQADLFAQLARSAQMRRFAVDVEQSGGQLPQASAERVAILVHHRDPAVVVDGHDRHRAKILDEFPRRDVAARHPDMVGPQRENLSGVQSLGRDRLEDVITHG